MVIALCLCKTLLKNNLTDGELFSGWRQVYEDDSLFHMLIVFGGPLLDYYDIFQSESKTKKIHKVCVTKGVIYHHEEEENHSHS